MDSRAVALVLDEIATLLDAGDTNRFRARAFRTAARAVEQLGGDLRSHVADGSLREVAGIGPATARVIEELVVTGEAGYHAELRERSPSGLRDLLRVPGLGPKKAAQLHTELGIADLDALEEAARAGRIAEVRGFGEQTQQRVLQGIGFARGAVGRRRFDQAEPAARRLSAYLAALPGIAAVHAAGELRRRLEVVDGIVLLVAVPAGAEPARVLAAVRATPGVSWTDADAARARGRLGDGFGVEVRLAAGSAVGAALLLATGSAAHIDALRRVAAARGCELESTGLRRHGVAVPTADEESVYRELGMQHVPPELRETGAEGEVAARGELPDLLVLDDLRGCFHCHTTYSDGTASVAGMAEAALALGWRYLGITDHSRNAGYAGGLSPARLARQHREIDAWNARRGGELRVFKGVEADILEDGQLDYAAQGDGAVLDACDFVIGSVHSRFRMGREPMTRRMERAAADPRLTMLGHATGRLLLARDGYDVDIDAVIAAAAGSGAVIEINSDPRRLDLSWRHWPRARELGVRAAVNPDAHSPAGLHNVGYGVHVARKAWLSRNDVVNAWPVEDIAEFLQARRRGAEAG
jgi:DNA polymerase (family X)